MLVYWGKHLEIGLNSIMWVYVLILSLMNQVQENNPSEITRYKRFIRTPVLMRRKQKLTLRLCQEQVNELGFIMAIIGKFLKKLNGRWTIGVLDIRLKLTVQI